MPQRNTVEGDLYLALAPYDLHGFTDALMDTLDDLADWDVEDESTPYVDTDIPRDMKKDDQQ